MKLSKLIKKAKFEKISIEMRKVKIKSDEVSEDGFSLSDEDLEKLKKFFASDVVVVIYDENKAYNLFDKSQHLGTYIESNDGIPSDYYEICSLKGMKFIWVNLYGGSSEVICKVEDAKTLWNESKIKAKNFAVVSLNLLHLHEEEIKFIKSYFNNSKVLVQQQEDEFGEQEIIVNEKLESIHPNARIISKIYSNKKPWGEIKIFECRLGFIKFLWFFKGNAQYMRKAYFNVKDKEKLKVLL